MAPLQLVALVSEAMNWTRRRGWPSAAVCLSSLMACVMLSDSRAWAQQTPTAPSVWAAREVALGDEPPVPGSPVPGEGNDPVSNVNDILSLADESLENLVTRPVIAPALQEVVTSVSRQKSTVGRSPAAVYVVTADMIRRSGATSIAEALRMVPGMNVAKRDNNKWAISVRGFNARYANKLLVQIDGRTVYTPTFAGTYWDVQDVVLEDIERIEVIRGPGATVWGANAVNGVVNVITKSADKTTGVYIKGGGGSEERGFGTVRVGGCQGDFAWRAYGKWLDRDGGFGVGGDSQDEWNQQRGGFRADWTPNHCDTFTLQSDAYQGTSGDTAIFFSGADDEQVQGHNVLGRWTRVLNDDSDYSLQLYYDANDRNSSALLQHIETLDVDFQYRIPIGCRHNVIWGLGIRRVDDTLVDPGASAITFVPPGTTKQTYTAFVQDEVTLCEDYSYLTFGTKVEKNDYTDFEIQPSIRLLWLPSETSAAWCSVSRAIRTPSRFDRHSRTAVGFGPTVFFGPSPGYQTEELIAYELGYRSQPTQEFSWDAAMFYNVYENLTSKLRTGVTSVVSSNEMAGDIYGLELACKYQVNDCWRLSGWYSLAVTHLEEAPFTAPATASVARDEGSSPRNQAYLNSSWDLGCDWELDLMARYVDSLAAQNVPSYIEMDLRLAWLPTDQLEVSIVGQNLLDSEHLEFGSLGGAPTPLVEAERGVYGAATWRY